MKTLIILAIAILGCVNAMGQQTVDLDKASQGLCYIPGSKPET